MKRSLLIALFVLSAWGAALAQSATKPSAEAQPAAQAEKIPAHPAMPTFQPVAQMPEEAREENLGGICVLSLNVDIAGHPHDIHLVRCSDPMFAEPSLHAVSKYRFKPATTADGTPTAMKVTIEIKFQLEHSSIPKFAIRFAFLSPLGTTSAAPGVDGVYPLARQIISPEMSVFSDQGYGNAAVGMVGNGACDVDLTIDADGVPSDAQVVRCDKPILEKPAVESLLKSRYMPGNLNGKIVPIRVTVHLEFAGFAPAK